MEYFKSFEIFTLLCIISNTVALKCWCCDSDEVSFCGKVLDESGLTNSQQNVNLITCPYPSFELLQRGDEVKMKCLIQKNNKNGDIVYKRSCIWEEKNAPRTNCFNHQPSFGQLVMDCETCVDEKCNYKFSYDSGSSTLISTLCEVLLSCLVIILII